MLQYTCFTISWRYTKDFVTHAVVVQTMCQPNVPKKCWTQTRVHSRGIASSGVFSEEVCCRPNVWVFQLSSADCSFTCTPVQKWCILLLNNCLKKTIPEANRELHMHNVILFCGATTTGCGAMHSNCCSLWSPVEGVFSRYSRTSRERTSYIRQPCFGSMKHRTRILKSIRGWHTHFSSKKNPWENIVYQDSKSSVAQACNKGTLQSHSERWLVKYDSSGGWRGSFLLTTGWEKRGKL